MDKTQKLKELILKEYGSIREFSKFVNIPSTTLTSALDKGIGGMAVDRIIKICEALNIDVKTFEPINDSNVSYLHSEKESILLEHYNKLNDLGKDEAIKRVSELTEINKYTECEEINTLEDLNPELIAAHDDDLTADEKAEADKRILEAIKKIKK